MTPHITLNFRVKGRLRLFTSHFSSGKKISSTISSMVAMETGSKVINHSCLTRSTGLSSYAGMLLLPLYYQQVRGQSVLASGLLLIPQGVGMLMTRSLAGKLTDTIGSRWVVLGGTILTRLTPNPFTISQR